MIVVLAGMLHTPILSEKGLEFNGAVERILAGEELLFLKKAPVLLITGSTSLLTQKGLSEAFILKNWLEKRNSNHNNHNQKIIAESTSKNTAESAHHLARMANQKKWKRILLVTSAYHMPRTMLCFQKAFWQISETFSKKVVKKKSIEIPNSVKIIPFPVDYQFGKELPWPESIIPNLRGLSLSTLALREFIGIIAYKLTGRI